MMRVCVCARARVRVCAKRGRGECARAKTTARPMGWRACGRSRHDDCGRERGCASARLECDANEMTDEI